MQHTDWLVIAAGLGGVVWVNWYFFLAGRDSGHAASASVGAAGALEARITIRGGYDPAVLRVKAGRAVRLRLDRQDTSSCSEEIVFPAFGIRKFLPAFETTTIEVTPPTAGTYEFTCGMGMLHGRLIAE
jgi:plastocyanin domain-containing protein